MNDVLKIHSNSEKETFLIGEKFAKSLDINSNPIVILSGDLGVGKTKFVQGMLTAFGLENEISSPTFTIVNEYKNDKVSFNHFDLYRLEDIDEFYAMGGDDYLSSGVCVFEWGEILEDYLKDNNYYKIEIYKDNEENVDSRIFKITYIENKK